MNLSVNLAAKSPPLDGFDWERMFLDAPTAGSDCERLVRFTDKAFQYDVKELRLVAGSKADGYFVKSLYLYLDAAHPDELEVNGTIAAALGDMEWTRCDSWWSNEPSGVLTLGGERHSELCVSETESA